MSREQVQSIGQQFLNTFVTMKHSGAVDKTQSGFQALAARWTVPPTFAAAAAGLCRFCRDAAKMQSGCQLHF